MAFNFGGAISGGMGGAATAGALGLGAATGGVGLIPWAVGTGLAGALGGGLMGGGGGKSGYTPYQFLQNPQYSWRQGDLKTVSDSARTNIESIMAGEVPWWNQRLADTYRSQSNRNLRNQFYGLPGDRAGSVVGLAEQAAAQTGLGAPAMMQHMGRASQNYMQQLLDIEDTINRYQMESVPSLLSNQQQMILQSPEGPSGTWVGGQSYSIPGSNVGQSIGQIGSLLSQLNLKPASLGGTTNEITGGGYGSYASDANYTPWGTYVGTGNPINGAPVGSNIGGQYWDQTLANQGVTPQPGVYGFKFGQ